MPDTILLLQLEHGKVAELLDLIDRQLTNLDRCASVNYRLLQNAFDYLSGYPDQCHHPKEDLVYRKLHSRYPDMARSLSAMVEEHEKLTRLTENLKRAIGETQHDPAATNDQLAQQLREFVGFYRHHMTTEEQHFFPAALRLLSRNDWAEIDFAIFDRPDPLLDRESEERFSPLRDEITRLGEAEKTLTGSREEAAWLAKLQGIAAFNNAMQRFGASVSLTRSPEGGYKLEGKGNVLLRIQECSESRAIWSAYFFLKGSGTVPSALLTTSQFDLPSARPN
jgi:hemerythrin-like domain-containing protein